MSKKSKMDSINVVDVEMSCWSNKEDQGDQKSEIVQIGICSYNIFTKEITKANSYLIKPELSTISPYCTALTGLDPKMKGAIPFFDACNVLKKKYGSKNRIMASYGRDWMVFRDDCVNKVADYPFGIHYINVSLLFHLKHLLKKNLSLSDALTLVNQKFDGTPHDAKWDAYNCAKLLGQIL